ncbi:hypothetical protein C8J57DRAFT_1657107, partial [Mycena rebaudengoi]
EGACARTQHAACNRYRDGAPVPVPVSPARLSQAPSRGWACERGPQRAPVRVSASGTTYPTPRPALPNPHRSYTTPHATWELPSVCSSSARRFATRAGICQRRHAGQGVRDAASQPAPAQLYTRARAVCRAHAGLKPRLEPPHPRRPSAASVCRSSTRAPPRHAGRARRRLATCACATRRSLRVRAKLGGANALPSQSAASASGTPCSPRWLVRVCAGSRLVRWRATRERAATGAGSHAVVWLGTCAHGSR